MKKDLLIQIGLIGIFSMACSSGGDLDSPFQTAHAKMFRGDISHSGVYQGADVKANPSLQWQFKTGGKVVSSPTVYGNSIIFGSYDSYLYSIDKRTGKVNWQFKTGDQIKSTPAVWMETVFFASKDGQFYALDAKTGKQRWAFKTQDAATQVYEKGIPWFPDGIDAGLYEAQGEKRFSQINDPWDSFYSSALIVDGVVYFGAFDGHVYALDALNGVMKWSKQTGGAVRSTPAYADGRIFVGSFDGNFYALNARNGEEQWRMPFVQEEGACLQFQSSPAIADGMVFFGGRDNYVHAVDAKTGKTVWQSFQAAWGQTWGSWVISSPAVHQGVVYIGTSDGLTTLALDAKTGAKKWEFKTERNVFGSPSIAGETLYITDFDAYAVNSPSSLYALDLKTGQEKWRYGTLGSQTSPVIDEGVIYFGTEDGYLVALK